MEQGLTKQRIYAELARSPHGKLSDYLEIGKQAVAQEGDFYQHLVAWTFKNSQIRDAKVALPVIGLAYETDLELVDNSVAHLAMLGPRELRRALDFIREIRPKGRMSQMDRVIRAYLREKEEAKGWDHMAILHRKVLKALYALSRTGPGNRRVAAVISGQWKEKINGSVVVTKLDLPKGSIFEVVARLKDMSPVEAAGEIVARKIPFLIAMGALGAKAKETDLVLALIGAMSPTRLTTNVKMLEKLGIKTNPALRGAFEKAMEKAATSKKNTLKTTQAVDAVEDEGLKEKLRGLQKKQIAAAGGPEGNWVVLADKSGSMHTAIEIARHVSASLAQFVKGRVHLVFFDTSPMTVDVTGLSLDQIQKATRHISAGGGTSIGCGLDRMLQEKAEIDGIVVVSDGGENTPPFFHDVHKKYTAFAGKDIPVYFFQCDGERDAFSGFMKSAEVEMQAFDLRGSKIDYYSIPNTVKALRSNQYGLVDEILATPLLSLSDVLKTAEPVGV